MLKYLPAHVTGQKLETYYEPASTLNVGYLDIGAYIRVSTQKESQQTSIDNQHKILAEWARINNYNLKEVYIDVKSGEYKYLRNDLNKMLEDVRNGCIKGVIVKEICRTSRDVLDMLEIKRKIAFYGGFIASIKEGYDSRRDEDEFFLILHAAMGQKERKTTASRVKLTQITKARSGKTNVPIPAYGYMLSTDKQTLVVNPETAGWVKTIFNKYVGVDEKNWGILKIVKFLNEKGIKTRTGKRWCYNSVKTILSNPVYIGVLAYNLTRIIRHPDGTQQRVRRPEEEWIVVEDAHQPLITTEIFEKAQALLAYNKENDKKEWSCDKKYLGSGILRCSECRGKIYGSRYKKKVKGIKIDEYYFRYRCSGQNGQCSQIKYWDMARVDQELIGLFKSIFSDENKLKLTVSRLIDVSDLDPLLLHERDLTKSHINDLEKAIKRQQEAYEAEVIELAEFKARLFELKEDLQRSVNRLNKMNEQLSKAESISSRFQSIYNVVKDIINDLDDLNMLEKSELLNSTFAEVYLNANYNIEQVVFRYN